MEQLNLKRIESFRQKKRDKAAEILKRKEKKVQPRREIDKELDKLEKDLNDLRVMYEQYFIDVLPQPPDEFRKDVVKKIKSILKAPFKKEATKFRLRMLITRFQTYKTYWERVLREREDGRYVRDIFKAELRNKNLEQDRLAKSAPSSAERSLKQLYSTYEDALKKSGGSGANLNFDSFKSSLIEKARKLKEEKGVKGVNFKVVVKDGKVVLKASSK